MCCSNRGAEFYIAVKNETTVIKNVTGAQNAHKLTHIQMLSD